MVQSQQPETMLLLALHECCIMECHDSWHLSIITMHVSTLKYQCISVSVPVFDAVLLINSLLTMQGKRQAKVETSGSDKAVLATRDCGGPIHKTTNCVNSIHILYIYISNYCTPL